MVKLLSALHAGLGRLPDEHLSRRALRRLGRIWLQNAVLERESSKRDDVTVLIGVQNRADERLVNALRSLRAQETEPEMLRVRVIDYGSSKEQSSATRQICERHGADFLKIETASVWSRSRCLNAGLRRTRTKFLMASDADLVFSPRYVADAVRQLRASPVSVVCSRMFDLPEESVTDIRAAASSAEPLPLEEWKRIAHPRYEWPHPSICMAYTSCFHLIRGYDEYYELWGLEDDDLMRRFVALGLLIDELDSGSFYLHQWHRKFEGVVPGRDSAPVHRNVAHFRSHRSILRNGPDWGARDRAREE